MASIAVFDSGLGSLSVVKAIRAVSKCDIIYYADTASHPYGTKDADTLSDIVHSTITGLREQFKPDLIVVGSNTPTLTLDIEGPDTIGVWPPLVEAARRTKMGRIAVLATKAVISGDALERYAISCGIPYTSIQAVDATMLVDMVESGMFLRQKSACYGTIRKTLNLIKDADTCTLSSTHLPFLRDIMEECRPDIAFLDPADTVARRAVTLAGDEGGNTLQIYSSGGYIAGNLACMGITQDVSRLGPFGNRG